MKGKDQKNGNSAGAVSELVGFEYEDHGTNVSSAFSEDMNTNDTVRVHGFLRDS